MGRGRAKGKKLTASNQEDPPGSGEEEKIPAQKRRGRPQKPLKDEVDEDKVQKIEDSDSEDTTGVLNKDLKSTVGLQNGKKRKRNSQEKIDVVKDEYGNGTKLSTGELSIRPNRNRRKNKPRRAAEAVVECN